MKNILRFMKLRSSEGSTWAGVSVLGLFLNQLTGYEVDGLLTAFSEAMPALLTGNWMGVLFVVVPAPIIAMLKQDKPGADVPPAPPQQMAAAVPPGARPQHQPGGFQHGS